MPNCGTQCWLCDLPIRFDTYKGCSHGCKYCFTQKKYDLTNIKPDEGPQGLWNFINGQRAADVCWADWDIPLHWGGMSDPFQPIEKAERNSYECLKVFAETQYPFVVSTKGVLIAEAEYLDLIAKCNCVVQISAVCDSYNELEPGCPSYEERLKIARKVAETGKRVIIRVQPLMHEVVQEVRSCLPRVADSGAYGIIIEGMKHSKSAPGLVRIAGDYAIDYATIRSDFLELREKGHELDLKVYAGENRIRELGDSLTCCGTDGVEGFKPNTFNINHFIHGDFTEPTEGQKRKGTADCFGSSNQTTAYQYMLKKNSFAQMMAKFAKEKQKLCRDVFGLSKK